MSHTVRHFIFLIEFLCQKNFQFLLQILGITMMRGSFFAVDAIPFICPLVVENNKNPRIYSGVFVTGIYLEL